MGVGYLAEEVQLAGVTLLMVEEPVEVQEDLLADLLMVPLAVLQLQEVVQDLLDEDVVQLEGVAVLLAEVVVQGMLPRR